MGQPGLLIHWAHFKILCFPPCKGSPGPASWMLPAVLRMPLLTLMAKASCTPPWERTSQARQRWKQAVGCPGLLQGRKRRDTLFVGTRDPPSMRAVWRRTAWSLKGAKDKLQVPSTLQSRWEQPGMAVGTSVPLPGAQEGAVPLSYTHTHTDTWKKSTA